MYAAVEPFVKKVEVNTSEHEKLKAEITLLQEEMRRLKRENEKLTAQCDRQISMLKSIRKEGNHLLTCESGTVESMESELYARYQPQLDSIRSSARKSEEQLATTQSNLKELKELAKRDAKFSRLTMDFLSGKHKDGSTPLFALVGVEEKECIVGARTVHDKYTNRTSTERPNTLANSFLAQYQLRDVSPLGFAAKLRTIVPAEVRRKIRQQQPHFDSIGILWQTEPEEWTQPKERIIPNRDPLVIGVKKINGKTYCWLLHQYNASPAESYIAREFAVNMG